MIFPFRELDPGLIHFQPQRSQSSLRTDIFVTQNMLSVFSVRSVAKNKE